MEIAVICNECQNRSTLLDMIERWSEEIGYNLEISVFDGENLFLKEHLENKFEMVFTDRIEIIEKIRKVDMHVAVVYMAEDEEHIVKSVMFHVFDCIKTPYSYEKISYVLNDFIKAFPFAPCAQLLRFRCGKKELSLKTSDILYITADNNYTVFTTKDGVKRCRIFFSKTYSMLHDKRFIICTRGVAVNMDYVQNELHGVFEMSDGRKFPIRRKDRKDIIDTFEQYKLNKFNSEKPQYEVCKI